MLTPLQLAINALNTAMLDLDGEISKFLDGQVTDANDVVSLLVAIHGLKSEMGDLYAGLCGKAINYFNEQSIDDIEFDGHRIEIRSAADRKKWDHARLVDAVARRLVESSIDLDTGEMTMTPQEMAQRLMEFVQPSYWRVKELSKLGLNADSFCDVGEQKTNIIVRKAK